jgi:hypothetical protein
MKEFTMRQFNIPTFSPDGFSGAAARQRDVVADAYSTIAVLAEASRKAAPAPVEDLSDRYDDGLVHEHRWSKNLAPGSNARGFLCG